MSNGMDERSIRTIKLTLSKAKRSGSEVYLTMLSLRSTPISGKLPSPAELPMGRNLQTSVPSYTPRILNYEHIRQALSDRQHTQAHYHDSHAHKLLPLSTGDIITTKHPTIGRWNRASIVGGVCTPTQLHN